MTSWIAPDAAPVADLGRHKEWAISARTGSNRLLAAIIRAQSRQNPPPTDRKLHRELPKPRGSRTWKSRMSNRAMVINIQRAACQHFGISLGELIGPRGDAALSRCRQVTMLVARLNTRASYSDIGICFNRDHSTVFHACDMIPDYDDDVVVLREKLSK